MNFNIYNKSKTYKLLLLFFVSVSVISVVLNVFIVKEEACFGAKEIVDYGRKTEYDDLIILSYNGYEYALLENDSAYDIIETDYPLTRFYSGSFIDSVFNEYMIYCAETDADRLFLRCNYKDWLRPYGGSYYRTDFKFPEPSSNNISRIDIYDSLMECYSIYDKDIIKYFLQEPTKYEYSEIKDYLNKEINIILAEDTYVVRAIFAEYPLQYNLGSFFKTTDDSN